MARPKTLSLIYRADQPEGSRCLRALDARLSGTSVREVCVRLCMTSLAAGPSTHRRA